MTGALWEGNLVGLPWALAEAQYRRRGVPFRTVATQPPRRPVIGAEQRVVQERQEAGGLVIVLAPFFPRSGQEAW